MSEEKLTVEIKDWFLKLYRLVGSRANARAAEISKDGWKLIHSHFTDLGQRVGSRTKNTSADIALVMRRHKLFLQWCQTSSDTSTEAYSDYLVSEFVKRFPRKEEKDMVDNQKKVSIKETLDVISALDFEHPSIIDFNGLIEKGLVTYDGSFHILNDASVTDAGEVLIPDEEFKLACELEFKLLHAFTHIVITECLKKRFDLESKRCILFSRFQHSTDETERTNLRFEIDSIDSQLNSLVVGN